MHSRQTFPEFSGIKRCEIEGAAQWEAADTTLTERTCVADYGPKQSVRAEENVMLCSALPRGTGVNRDAQ